MKKILYITTIALILTACKSNKASEGDSNTYVVPEEILSIPEGTKPGLRAPEITLTDIKGDKHSLSDLQGKVVLIDFWAAWCNPCRKENPVLVKVYEKYHDASFETGEGFEIFSVSLDRDEEAWKKAIADDKLSWEYMLGDMKGARTQAAVDYGIQMIPANFLINKNGVIIAFNLRGEALEIKLESMLKQE